MRIDIISLKGHRKTNEDSETVELNLDGKNPNLASRNMFGVYDGHGSENGGKIISTFLSKIMPMHLMDKRTEFPLKKTYVKNLYNSVQELIKTKLHKISEHNGSTCLIVVQYIHNGAQYLDVLNTGDSRCIICKENKSITKQINVINNKSPTFTTTALTIDHKPNTVGEKNRISTLNGLDKITFDGFDHRILGLSVSRSFSDFDSKPFVTCMPDLFRYKIESNDRFLVLGCDGLYDNLQNSEITDFIISHYYDTTTWKKTNTKKNIAKLLAEYAINVKKSTDNVSVIIVFFD